MSKLKIMTICLVAAMLCGCGREITIEKYEILDGRQVLVFKGKYKVTGDQKLSNFQMKLPDRFEVRFDQEATGAGIDSAIDVVGKVAEAVIEGKLVRANP